VLVHQQPLHEEAGANPSKAPLKVVAKQFLAAKKSLVAEHGETSPFAIIQQIIFPA